MANELTLIMKTPVEELVPKLLAWNNEELLAAVEQRLKNYQGITYDESQVATAKADRAQLNAFCKALNDERIRIGKVYTSPYDKFKAEVDEVVHRVKAAVDEIDTQVKAFENAKQERKLQEIKDYFNSVVGEFSGLIPYERIHQTKWLNASTSIKSVMADIDAVLDSARNALTAISALRSEDEDTLKAFYFRTLNLSEALMENERLKAERARIADFKAKQAAAEQKPVEVVPEVVVSETVADKPKTQTVRFQVEGTVEQLKALQHFLKDNNIKYSAI